MQLDEVELADLRRCRNCGGKLLRAIHQDQLRQHLGHRLSPPAEIHFWEFVRIKLGWL
jgi:hypothetical protein